MAQPLPPHRERVLFFAVSIAALMLLSFLEPHFPVSRRLANATYALFIVAYNAFQLGVFATLAALFPGASDLAAAVNRSGLFVFLLANVLTGTVNLSMKTIYADDATAMLVLAAYLFAVFGTAHLLHQRNITLKFW
jgi:phosphatidylinositol glycan class W